MSPIFYFFVSGATSLVLQVVWVRKLTEVFGSSTLAISTVLATFMAGLALGSWIGGRLADRVPVSTHGAAGWTRSPLLYYAVCEGTVCVVALVIPMLVAAYRPVNAVLWLHLGETPVVLALARFALTATVLLIPTTAMGATLPLLGRHVTRSHSDLTSLSRRLGFLYAANTAGAVLGAASAGFWLLPALGESATNRLAACIAGGLATTIVVALIVRRNRPPAWSSLEAELAASDVADAPAPELETRQRRAALAVYAVSGAAAMALEVLWSRALAVVIGSSVYSFTLILVVFLIGIAFGSAVMARPAERTRDPARLLALCLALTGGAIVLTHLAIDDLPGLFLIMIQGASFRPQTILSIHSLLVGVVILPGALGLGAIMPLAMRVYVGSLDRVGRDVGRAYGFNTLGAIVGSLVGGIVVMPLLGVEHGVLLCAGLYAACAALVLVASRRLNRLTAAVAALTLVGIALAPRWNLSNFTAGLFRTHLTRHYLGKGGLFQREVPFYADGIATTVSVEHSGTQWTLKNNGKTEASNKTDMPTQILVGLMPVLFHAKGHEQVFVVGYGSGVTVGAITQSPRVDRIDVVELEPRVLEAADRYFASFNHSPQNDPEVHRFIGDGRDVLLAGDKHYDVIVSEPSNPWMAGVSSLFTREFYRFARSHLAPGGVFCQWAQLYELGPRNIKMIYATFGEAFPFVYAFTPGDGTSDTILIGSLEPLVFDLDVLAERMKDPMLAQELARADVDSPESLMASLFLGPNEVAAFTAGADINTDDNARLEYGAPLDLLRETRLHLAAEIRTIGWPYGRLDGVVELGSAAAERATRLATELVGYGRYREAQAWTRTARAAGGSSTLPAAERLIELAWPVDFRDPELPITASGPPLPELTPDLFRGTDEERRRGVDQVRDAYECLARGDWVHGYQALHDLPERADTDAGHDIDLLLAYLTYKSTELRSAWPALSRLATPAMIARRPAALYYLARTLLGLGKFAEGKKRMLEFVTRYPELARQAAESRL